MKKRRKHVYAFIHIDERSSLMISHNIIATAAQLNSTHVMMMMLTVRKICTAEWITSIIQ